MEQRVQQIWEEIKNLPIEQQIQFLIELVVRQEYNLEDRDRAWENTFRELRDEIRYLSR